MGELDEKFAVLLRDTERLSKESEAYFAKMQALENQVSSHEPRLQIVENGYSYLDKIIVRGNGIPSLQEEMRSQKTELGHQLSKIRKLEDGQVAINTAINKLESFMDRFDESINNFSKTMEKFFTNISNLQATTEKISSQVENKIVEIENIKTEMDEVKLKIEDVDEKGKIDIILLIKKNITNIILGILGGAYVLISLKPTLEQIAGFLNK